MGTGEEFAEEDLIPQWANKVLQRKTGTPPVYVLSQRLLGPDGDVVGDTTHQRRQTLSAIKVLGVCDRCNTQWMSRIERLLMREGTHNLI